MKHNLYKFSMCLAMAAFGFMEIRAQEVPEPPKEQRAVKKAEKLNRKLDELAIKLNEKVFTKLDIALANLGEQLENIEISIPEIDVRVYDGEEYEALNGKRKNLEEKRKTISKSYTVNSKDKLDISNQFGKVIVNTWDKNTIKVDVLIVANEATEGRAQELLNGVSVTESRQGNLISFKTTIERKSANSWWARMGGDDDDRKGVQINYTVYMPAKNPLSVTNKYGSTNLPRLDGPVSINNSYGSLSARGLNNPANQVKVTYGSARIEDFTAGNINVSYGSLSIEKAGRLNADVNKGGIKIGSLSGGGVLESKYGSVRIDELEKGIKDLAINASYGGVSLGINDGVDFGFDVTVSYGGFNYSDSRLNLTSSSDDDDNGWNSTKNYKGQYGKASPSKIIIKTQYGGVKFM